ncbi:MULTISPECIES: hypothetical protein [Bacillus cereus group]|uniref:Uncharacterized protein n=1 Tax=Bacillus thuringiensis TaxID=1428 RepID=A0A9X6WHD6_BACTU|nr:MULTISPECIES: hypothetical protein [Bacillus cereus group]PFJ28952.1 hypothetical protein COJ15_32300 [Bacillus thuringiensis]PGP14554.1 hypothetical protein COA01_29775 [Bacillus cereus]
MLLSLAKKLVKKKDPFCDSDADQPTKSTHNVMQYANDIESWVREIAEPTDELITYGKQLFSDLLRESKQLGITNSIDYVELKTKTRLLSKLKSANKEIASMEIKHFTKLLKSFSISLSELTKHQLSSDEKKQVSLLVSFVTMNPDLVKKLLCTRKFPFRDTKKSIDFSLLFEKKYKSYIVSMTLVEVYNYQSLKRTFCK